MARSAIKPSQCGGRFANLEDSRHSKSAILEIVAVHLPSDVSDAKAKYPEVGLSGLARSVGAVRSGGVSGVANLRTVQKLDSWFDAGILESSRQSTTLRIIASPGAEFGRSGIWVALHTIGFIRSADSWDRFTRLYAILDDLNGAKSEAQEQGYPEPTQLAIRNAKYLLEVLYKIVPLRYEVYPTNCGEIAIDTPGGLNASALILCASDGSVMYIASSGKEEFSEEDLSVEAIPDFRLCQILTLLAKELD